MAKGYQLTFDTTGYIGNYPLEAATAAGAADAIFIMGYDYRSSGSSPVGSIAPDRRRRLRHHRHRQGLQGPRPRLEAHPRRALLRPRLVDEQRPAPRQQHERHEVRRVHDRDLRDRHRRPAGTRQALRHRAKASPGRPTAARTARRTYGCVTSWRQLYLDDARALKAKYDIVNSHGLRGAGIWALGYDNARPELWAAIKDKFVSKTPFTDVDDFAAAIEWLYTSGITDGCSATLFCPTARVTRAQMAMFLDRALDLPARTTDYFDDDDGKTGEASINALAKAGITGGCGPRRFCPTAYVTRAQMAMFLDRALDLPNATTDYFDDDDGRTGEVSINALAAAGITGGCGPRRYCPAGVGDPRADGRLPVPRPPAGPPRLSSTATLPSMIDPAARVHPSAELEDDVTVGAGSAIWQRAQVRTRRPHRRRVRDRA